MKDPIHILSLGAGVQSSTMALMAAHGEITPMPEAAIFADTGDEPRAVYEWLDRLEKLLPFPVVRVNRPNHTRLSEHLFEWGQSQIPAFVRSDTGPAMGKRQCTKHWKIVPVQQGARRFLALQRKRLKPGAIVMWQGISWDEMIRMKDSRELWIQHRFPLIDSRMTRTDCVAWLTAHGYETPPKSACCYCPYQSRAQWAATKAANGEEWKLALAVDRQLAATNEYLTADLRRIDEINFSRPRRLTPRKKDGQAEFTFAGECEGMCGV